ncbi:DoxX family protein [Winogradskyella sp. UBA3174]|uniref:DoxX family protein n=1 Tax=Winogradskyella sp. UBA3174 TaxID=1947785 RepID=UPI0025FEB7F3|nr:DoxX family protein [Winogradskyella sp. UBA3174]|tara:strand:- start:9937 stop:10296 length:360 start_codon:yes stop_codon:yes gene_type:complete
MTNDNIVLILSLISGVSFIYYGLSCFKSRRVRLEFERYGLPHRRVLTGVLQLLGGIGLLTGLYLATELAFSASLGLTILMFLGFSVRLKIKDGFFESAPSLIFALLNLYLCYRFFLMIS